MCFVTLVLVIFLYVLTIHGSWTVSGNRPLLGSLDANWKLVTLLPWLELAFREQKILAHYGMLLSYFLQSNQVFEVILGMIGLLFSVWQKWKSRCFTSYKWGLGMEFGTESQRWIAGALLGMRHHSLNCGVRSISNTEGKSSVLLMDFKIFFSPNLETFLEND